MKNFVEVLPKRNALFPPYLFCHLIVSSFPRSFTAAWAVVLSQQPSLKNMGGLTPPKKPSASQMRQKALKCTVELEIQAVSTSTRVSFLTKTKYIPVCVCYDVSFRVSILLATVAIITEDRVSPSVKVATIRSMLINTPAFISASEVFIKSNAQAKLLDVQPSCQHLFVFGSDGAFAFVFHIEHHEFERNSSAGIFDHFFTLKSKRSHYRHSY